MKVEFCESFFKISKQFAQDSSFYLNGNFFCYKLHEKCEVNIFEN